MPSLPLSRAGFTIAALLSVLIALVSYRFLLGAAPPDPVLGNRFLSGWLPLHATAAATALLLGPLQFVARLRNAHPKVHRWTGRTYATACLLGGASGLVLALGASTGPVSTAGFGLLALAWLGTTAQGWRMARQGRYALHREWMIRSFALTFGAVMLRLYIPLSLALGLPFEDSYRAISFLAWVPNLLLVELVLSRTRRRGAAPA
jgi:uncharacterized membrane protein